MNAAEIAAALGSTQRSGRWWRCVCPVHGSRTGHSATLALQDGPDGLIVRCFADCRREDILAELRRRGLLGGGAERCGEARPPIDPREHERRIAVACRIWEAGRDARGTPVAHYLAGRGIPIEPPPCLRWALRCWHRGTGAYLPAMLARVDGPDGELVGVHRTYLRRDGGGWHRRDRASLGPIAGGAVRLAPAADMLLVGEGIESVLSAMILGRRSGWAALSTSGLKVLILPPMVRDIIIAADHDKNGAGERAARAAALRWVREGRRVRIALPSERGTDFNDLLRGHRAEGVRHAA